MSKADELAEEIRREGARDALWRAAEIVREAGFANADGYHRWLNDAGENAFEGRPLDARRPRKEDATVLPDSSRTDGSRVLRDYGWRPENSNTTIEHKLFQMTQGDWYCTGCQWAFVYRVGYSRAREVWRAETGHAAWDVEEPAPEVPPKLYITEMRRRVDENAEGDVSFGRAEMEHALNSYDLAVGELNVLRGKVERAAALPAAWASNSTAVSPPLNWSSWETRRQDARSHATDLANALDPSTG